MSMYYGPSNREGLGPLDKGKFEFANMGLARLYAHADALP